MDAAPPDPAAQASFHAEQTRPDTWVITVIGEVDLANHHHFQAAADLAMQAAPAKLIFDLADVHFMDSFALRILITATWSPAAVTVRSPSPAVRRLIEITGLTTILSLTE